MWALLSIALLFPEAKLVGETELTVMWFRIYQAELYTDSGKYTGIEAPLWLQLTYLRNIKQSKLLSETQAQWHDLGLDQQHDLAPWLAKLKQLWPSVRKGDQLLFVMEPKRSLFYLNDKLLGQIDDPAFGPAFAAIWLAPNANYSKNRLELIGATP